MNMHELLVQAVGFTGMFLLVISYQIKSNRIYFLLQTAGSAAFVIQFGLLGALSGSVNTGISIVRNIIMLKYRDWTWVRHRALTLTFVAAHAAVLCLTWNGPVSVLAFMGAAAITLGIRTNNAQKIRLATLVCGSPSWLLYDILVLSWGGACNEVITIASILISIKRYGWKEMGAEDSEFQTR